MQITYAKQPDGAVYVNVTGPSYVMSIRTATGAAAEVMDQATRERLRAQAIMRRADRMERVAERMANNA